MHEPFFTIDVWTLIFTWVNLIILFLLMKKLLFKPVKNIIDQRQSEIDKMYTDAEESKNRAEEMEKDYTQKLSEAKQEANSIVSTAVKTAQLNSEKIMQEAQAQVSAMKAAAHEQIDYEKKTAVSEAKADIASMAVAIAEKVIEKEINEEDYERLVEKCIDEMGDN